MRWRTGIALGVLVLAVAGCGGEGTDDRVATAGGEATPTGSTSAEPGDAYEQALKFAACMRENGVQMEDPSRDEGINLMVPEGTDKELVDEATEKCKEHMPEGGPAGKADPEQLERARQMSKCIREHGFPNFPDPDENGGIALNGDQGFDPMDPKLKEAEKACGIDGPRRLESKP